MSDSPVKSLTAFGQSPWLDFIQRDLLNSGELQSMIERWDIRGITTNPAIFAKAITHSADYDEQIAALAASGCSSEQMYEALVLKDVRTAADVLRATYERTNRTDGFVSLEVSPHLAHDTDKTIAQANRLWRLLDRPNVMIKVPATLVGLQAVRQLIAAGINVNVTLLFSVERYQNVIDAYLAGLEDAQRAGLDLACIASVASFFLSRIDTRVDRLLDQVGIGNNSLGDQAQHLKGEVAVACARRAYEFFQQSLSTVRYRSLAERGATPQRLLWASTGTKNPAYSDIQYVEPLVGEGTVNTMPLATLRAYDDHGNPAARLSESDHDTARTLAALEELGIDLRLVTEQLLAEGLQKFTKPFDALLRTLGQRAA